MRPSPSIHWRLVAMLYGFGGLTTALAGDPPQDATAEPDWQRTILELEDDARRRPYDQGVTQQLAVAHNNYGVSLSREGRWEQAAAQLEEAIRLDEANERFRENLSHVYLNQAHQAYQRHQPQEALAILDKTLDVTPNLARAYSLRGEIEYDRQKLKEAQAAWQRAVALDPDQPEIVKRLNQVTQELPVESKFDRLSQAYFDLRYEDQLERPLGFDIRDALLQARRIVGSDFSYWPRHKVVVLIYSAESFKTLRQETPDWVAGQFDGKIRVPLPGSQLSLETVKQILFHEYTHAVIHDLTQGACPTWLNEGLAEYESKRATPTVAPQLAQALQDNRLIPWLQLSDRFSRSLPVDTVALAYQQAYSMAAYLVERYGMWRMRQALKGISQGRSWDAMLVELTHTKLSRIETNWREWLPKFLEGSHR